MCSSLEIISAQQTYRCMVFLIANHKNKFSNVFIGCVTLGCRPLYADDTLRRVQVNLRRHGTILTSTNLNQHTSIGSFPYDIYASEPITHRKSVFQAFVSRFTFDLPLDRGKSVGGNPQRLLQDLEIHGDRKRRLEALFTRIQELHPRTKRATHRMWAYRCRPFPVSNSPMRTTLPPPSSPYGKSKTQARRLASSSPLSPNSPSGPTTKYVMASFSDVEPASGAILERLLTLNDHADVAIVVHRWYSGVHIGGERWRCISNVAVEALKSWKAAEQGSAPRSKGRGR